MDELAIVSASTLLVFAKYLASGIGVVASHRLAPWMARQRADADLIAAQADADARVIAAQGDADAQIIRAGGDAGSLRLIAEAQEEVRSQLAGPAALAGGEIAISNAEIQQRVTFQEEKRYRNIASIADQALVELASADVRDHEPDPDWTARFFNEAQDVSSEEMQVLWAKVLAGEVERPGSTSLRTLSILRDLNSDAATVFQRLCSLTVSIRHEGAFVDARVPTLGGDSEGNALKDHDLGFGQLNILNEHGLIISDYNSWRDYRSCIGFVDRESSQLLRIPFWYQNRFWILEPTTARNRDQEFRLTGVALTHAGGELSRIVDLRPDAAYTEKLDAFFKRQGLRMVEVAASELHALPHWPPPPAGG